jgi:hypothetical protein
LLGYDFPLECFIIGEIFKPKQNMTLMKKAFLLTASFILLALVFSSCKKEKTKTTTEKLQYNWTIVNYVENYHDASGDNIETTNASTGDFMNFGANATMTFQIYGQTGTGPYSLTSDTQLLIAAGTFTIKTLNDTQLVLYSKEVYSSTEYDEVTINLTKK